MEVSQEFLDENQYSRRNISRYEKIFGEGSISSGGMQKASDLIQLLNLKEGQCVLDVGAGIGGQAFYMAETYQVHVTGIDYSNNMVSVARERLEQQSPEVKNLVEFHTVDVNNEDLPEGKFDVVHCRDVMMHISGKKLWFEKFRKALKPGGRVIVSNYFRGDRKNSEEFLKYVEERKYSLVTAVEFKQIFEDAGFVNVKLENRSEQFGKSLEDEIKRLEENREIYVQEFSKEEYEHMLESWKAKLRRNKIGDHQWGFVHAENKK